MKVEKSDAAIRSLYEGMAEEPAVVGAIINKRLDRDYSPLSDEDVRELSERLAAFLDIAGRKRVMI